MTDSHDPPYDGYHKYDQRVARSYEEDRKVEEHWWREDQFVREFVASRTIGSLLDLPVGTGRYLAHYGSVGRVTGIDISESMLTEARARLEAERLTHVELERGDVFGLRFADDHFDVAIVSRLFHLLPPNMLAAAIRELARVTRGELLLQTYVVTQNVPVQRRRLSTRLRTAVTTRARRLARRFVRTPEPTQVTSPWAHIQAFYHERSLVDSLFAASKFSVTDSQVIDRYHGQDVRMTVYRKD